jgi:hypothetical protein
MIAGIRVTSPGQGVRRVTRVCWLVPGRRARAGRAQRPGPGRRPAPGSLGTLAGTTAGVKVLVLLSLRPARLRHGPGPVLAGAGNST